MRKYKQKNVGKALLLCLLFILHLSATRTFAAGCDAACTLYSHCGDGGCYACNTDLCLCKACSALGSALLCTGGTNVAVCVWNGAACADAPGVPEIPKPLIPFSLAGLSILMYFLYRSKSIFSLLR